MDIIIIITLMLCFLVMFVAFIGTFVRIVRSKTIDLVDWFVISIGGYNGVGVSFVLIEIQDVKYTSKFRDILYWDTVVWRYPLYSLICLISVWIGCSFVKNIEILTDVSCGINKKFSCNFYVEIRVGIILFVSSVILYWIYVMPYGGFVDYLKYSSAIRAALFDEVGKMDRSLSFLRRFGGFSLISTLIFGGLLLSYRDQCRSKIHVWLLFFSSLSFSLYVLYSWGGRLGMLTYAASFISGYFLYKNGYTFKYSLKMTIPLLLILCLLPFSSKIWGKNKGGSDVGSFFVKEISYPLFVFDKAIKSNDYRWMQDIILSPLYILPERIWSGIFKIDTVSQISTERVVGVRKGVNGSTITVPVDFISFGVIEGGLFGVILTSLFFGYLLKKINGFLIYNLKRGCSEMIYGYIIFSLPVQLVLYGDPKHIISRNFSVIVGISLLVFANKKRKGVK